MGNQFSAILKQTPAVLTVVAYDRRGKPYAQGSGFIIDSSGLAASSLHVLRDAFGARALGGDGTVFDITAIEGFDDNHDVVTFKLLREKEPESTAPFKTVSLGSSKTLMVGDRVATLTSPEGLQNSVSDGVLSAVRTNDNFTVLQITAPISHGSSGGPVFDSGGRVVGVATAQLGTGQSLNFAIPIEAIEGILNRRADLTLTQLHLLLASAKHESTRRTTSSSVPRSSDRAPSAVASEPNRIRVQQGVTQGLLIHKVQPIYPAMAREARVQGSVQLQALIGKDGAIENLSVISGHPLLAPAAVEAVKQWQYRPYMVDGQPVEVETQITVNFMLSGQ